MHIPFIRPNPPKLSGLTDELAAIEASGVFSNHGPVNTRLEHDFRSLVFGTGACLGVCNATIGLMLALRHAAGWTPGPRRYALMPSFTFAATAQAALWAGLTPLLCDIDPDTWLPSARSEAALIERFGDEIAVIVPYATFGNALDLDRYERLARQHRIPVVVDAAASLGCLDAQGRAFASGFPFPVVFSMHATKAFATGEAGLIYCADAGVIEALRTMSNFGFGQPRSATMPGLNAKLSEVGALLARAKLREFGMVVGHRAELAEHYRTNLPGWTFQQMLGQQHSFQFMPVLLPEALAPRRAAIIAALAEANIGVGAYFSPHLAEQPFFAATCQQADLATTEHVASRALALPLSDFMTHTEVEHVCQALQRTCQASPTHHDTRHNTRTDTRTEDNTRTNARTETDTMQDHAANAGSIGTGHARLAG